MTGPFQQPNQEQTFSQEELEKEREKALEKEREETMEILMRKSTRIRPYKKSCFCLSALSLITAGYFAIAPHLASKHGVIKDYESGTRVVEILRDKDTYTGEMLSKNRFRGAIDSLENDLENLKLNRSFEIYSKTMEDDLKNSKRNSYIGLAATILCGLASLALEMKENFYKRRFDVLNRPQKYQGNNPKH